MDLLKQCEKSKQKWNFIVKKLGNHIQGINVSEIEIDRAKTVHKNAICNAFNKSSAEMGNYSGDFVPLNIHKLGRCSEKFNFGVLTLKEIYKVVDSLENSKSLGQDLSMRGHQRRRNTELLLICKFFF